MIPSEKMYSAKEVAAVLGFGVDTVRRLIYRGYLKAVVLPTVPCHRKRIYRSARISGSELERFISAHQN
jgi:predicted site-specific integrase-resolvase